jgi:DNA-binding transcriptional ArsR family regulator
MLNEALALDVFAALSQETRLRMVRALVQAGPEGLAAGEIAEAVGISASGGSFHLAHLERAGLVQARRESRSVIYSVRFDVLGGLVAFLMRDCCSGHPEICATAAAVAAQCKSAEPEAACAC